MYVSLLFCMCICVCKCQCLKGFCCKIACLCVCLCLSVFKCLCLRLKGFCWKIALSARETDSEGLRWQNHSENHFSAKSSLNWWFTLQLLLHKSPLRTEIFHKCKENGDFFNTRFPLPYRFQTRVWWKEMIARMNLVMSCHDYVTSPLPQCKFMIM